MVSSPRPAVVARKLEGSLVEFVDRQGDADRREQDLRTGAVHREAEAPVVLPAVQLDADLAWRDEQQMRDRGQPEVPRLFLHSLGTAASRARPAGERDRSGRAELLSWSRWPTPTKPPVAIEREHARRGSVQKRRCRRPSASRSQRT